MTPVELLPLMVERLEHPCNSVLTREIIAEEIHLYGRRQYARIVSGNDVVQLLSKIRSSEYDVRCALLKIRNHKHLIFIAVAVPISMDMIV